MESRRIHIAGTGIGRGASLGVAALAAHLASQGTEVVVVDDHARLRDEAMDVLNFGVDTREEGSYTRRPARGKQRQPPLYIASTPEERAWNQEVDRRNAEKAARKAAKGSP